MGKDIAIGTRYSDVEDLIVGDSSILVQMCEWFARLWKVQLLYLGTSKFLRFRTPFKWFSSELSHIDMDEQSHKDTLHTTQAQVVSVIGQSIYGVLLKLLCPSCLDFAVYMLPPNHGSICS